MSCITKRASFFSCTTVARNALTCSRAARFASCSVITRLGKFVRRFSLQDLPQLFNVLGGSISLVGPRPHLAAEVAQMPQEANRRSLVSSGLTGLWQVSGRWDLGAEDAIQLDLRYVENWSLSLDLLILWKTIGAVLGGRGAY
jgi:lipopolysaccharide/colanic/teichoic acid biosynthesis glycosyltransferase